VVGVAKERLKSPRVRLFVALDLPDRVRKALAAWGRAELVDPALRPIPPENLHITLAFLGWCAEKQVGEIGEAVAASVGPAPLVELRDPEQRPRRGRARIFALPAVSPGTELLEAGLRERLVEGRFYKPEKRPFWPHLTVARVGREERGSNRPAFVERPPGALPAELREGFFGVRMTLYRSELKPTGARYTPLAQIKLPGAGGS
jgi:2'-5' RNA ligase